MFSVQFRNGKRELRLHKRARMLLEDARGLLLATGSDLDVTAPDIAESVRKILDKYDKNGRLIDPRVQNLPFPEEAVS